MALMTNAEKREALRLFMYNPRVDNVAVTKDQIRAAIDAIDAYDESVAPARRLSVAAPTRAAMTALHERLLNKAIMEAKYS